MKIECADGESLPYIGYTIVHIEMSGVASISESFPFLVVPTTPFSEQTPCLLGTNVLKRFRDQYQVPETVADTLVAGFLLFVTQRQRPEESKG